MEVSKLYNLEKLEAMNDESFTIKMIDLFITEIPIHLNLIQKSLDKNDYKSITAIAHKIKPSVDFLCIQSLYEAVKVIDKWQETDSIMIEKTTQFIDQMKDVIKQLNSIK